MPREGLRGGRVALVWISLTMTAATAGEHDGLPLAAGRTGRSAARSMSSSG